MAKKTTKVETKPIEEIMPAPVEEPVVEENKYVVVTADCLNVRSDAAIESDILSIVYKGDKLVLLDSKLVKGFYAVSIPAGINGYVMKDFVIKE